ncbi:phage tail sheath C-terminal domain-containing protein [Streptomyces sp. NPDC048161]|uniref:phage tail sheath family protein n=1 Tax=Streptomyces sp. NPDC048161 TaxID=3160985 RepID=UPI0033D42D1E
MSPNPLAPGVYVDELSSGIHTITGVGTSTPAFLGFTAKAADDPATPRLVRSWNEFTKLFHYEPGANPETLKKDLATCTESLQNLDKSCTAAKGTFKSQAVTTDLSEAEFTELDTLQEKKKNGKALTPPEEEVVKADARKLQHSIQAYICWNNFVLEHGAVTKQKEAIVEELAAIAQADPMFLPEAVYGFFANGGAACYIVRLDSTKEFSAELDGNERERTGLAGLESLHDVSMVAVPDLWAGAGKKSEQYATLMGKVVAHCSKTRNRVAVVEPPPDLDNVDVKRFLTQLPSQNLPDAEFTALYYPWVTVTGLNGAQRTVPPCGHIAGVWARTDAERGVFKAPANQNLRGVLEIPTLLSDAQHGELNELGLNCLRVLPGQGLLVWGARTRSSTRDWKYLNVRRLVCFLAESIRQSSTWAVFEPNDDRLWASLRHAVTSFLTDQWRQGALLGRTPAEAFYVVCDSTNNTSETIDAGEVHCDIGVAPVRPAEFVHFTITQITGQPGQSS